MRKVTFEVVGYGIVEQTEHFGGAELSFYFTTLALQVGAPSLEQACAIVDEVVAVERERQMADSMW